jgi:large subunit ribosomal protein L35
MKLKTHKTTAKRLKLSGSGKIMIPTTAASHLRHNKSKRQLAAAKDYKVLAKGMAKRFSKLVPYLK